MIGVHYKEVPQEVLEEIEEKFDGNEIDFLEYYKLDWDDLWYEADIEGMMIGKFLKPTYKEGILNMRKVFEEVESILKVKCMLFGTQDIG